MGLLDGKGQTVRYAAPGENVQIFLNIANEDAVKRGDVLCNRDTMMPVTDLFEAEMDILDLLDYKPLMTKGYTCIMHIHTYNDEVIIKDLISTTETDEKGEIVTKQKPQFARSQSKVICRVQPKNPVACEKFDSIQQMGRFTLRDEGRTIAVGKVLKYKPYSKGVVGASAVAEVTKKMAAANIVTVQAPVQELVYNMDDDTLAVKKPEMGAIAEGDEDY